MQTGVMLFFFILKSYDNLTFGTGLTGLYTVRASDSMLVFWHQTLGQN